MKQPFPALCSACLIAGVGAAAALRGGHSRLYWPSISILMLGLLAAFIVLSSWQGRRPRLDLRLDLLFIAYFGWITLSAVFSINREESLGEVLRMTIPLAAYVLTAYAVRSRQALVFGLGGIIFVEALIGVLEAVSPGVIPAAIHQQLPGMPERAYGSFVNSNHFALFMEAGVFLSFGALNSLDLDPEAMGAELTAKRAFFAIPTGVMIIALVLSMSRGGWASGLAGLVFFGALFRWSLVKNWKQTAVLAGVILVLAGAFMIKANRTLLAKRFQAVEALTQEDELSANERVSLWKSSLEMVRDHPLLGMGWGTFKDAYPSYRRDDLFAGVAFAHNDYLQMAATSGIPALVFFLIFVATAFAQGFKVIARKAEDFETRIMPGLLAAMFAMLMHEFVDFGLMLTANAMVFFIFCGIIAAKAGEAA